MENNKKSIPSPFMTNHAELIEDLMKIEKKYNLKELFVAMGEQNSDNTTSYKAWSNSLSDGMNEYLEICINWSEDEIEKKRDSGEIE